MTETRDLEHYLLNNYGPEDQLLMQAKLLLSKELREKAYWQKQSYLLIRHYSRNKLKAEIEAVHNKMFSEKKFESFRKKIVSIFKTNL